ETELRSYISVPIGEVGVFQAASKRKGAFNKTDIELAEILAGHLSEEVKRIRLEEELKEQAVRDPLTELYNRRYFNETLSKEVERSERYSRPIAFLMIDVNRFKEINDRYSHQTGDEVLKEVAKLLKDNIREVDTVVRYGGDEFLIMLPETDGESSYTVTRLREKLEEWNRNSDLLDFPLTLAIGSTHWSPEQDREVEKALKEVDEKMYEDKRESNNGR
ncbi:sensor domain-containing diguanylate cyclase, partial [Candidatus Bipolaricaulota bacterium]|nr:sensor domain-containing diguanylate cyclase [Candidatus Bipolaricaulota bacterium]